MNSPLESEILAILRKHEQEHAAENNAPTVVRLASLAQSYDRATADHATDAHREHLAAEVAEELSLAEAGTIRRAAKALELGMPGIICRARATGMEPNEIARQLGATGSYVRRILRENQTMLAEASRARRAEQRSTRPVVEQVDTRMQLLTEMARHDHEADAARSRPTNAERIAAVEDRARQRAAE